MVRVSNEVQAEHDRIAGFTDRLTLCNSCAVWVGCLLLPPFDASKGAPKCHMGSVGSTVDRGFFD
jgi:hypothetical protein